MSAKLLMFQGTGSDVGKSLIVAGLARALVNRGLRVAPFKPQNMSNNAAVTVDGGEIGRAQALQARAARLAPSVHMNPVLLKPQGDGSQIVVQGRVVGSSGAADYQHIKAGLMPAVLDSLNHLRREADIVLVEGAGSASEVNLRANDIANMGFATAANAPVILIGDIDRGGVIASIVGTKVVIDPADAALVQGFIINRFRGDPALFADGMTTIAARTGWRAVGLVPHLAAAARLPAEDGLGLSGKGLTGKGGPNAPAGRRLRIAVVVLPHISNFDDLDPLETEPQIEMIHVGPGEVIPGDIDLVILPGSKATIPALAALRESGLDIDIAAHVRRGGHVLGICGGYQMLGRSISDPAGLEGVAGTVAGLGLLDVETVLGGDKTLRVTTGQSADGAPFSGYEMHVGVTTGPGCARPLAHFADGRSDGAVSASGRVAGCYIHGLFADDAQRAAWLRRLGGGGVDHAYEAGVEAALDALAAHLETHLDINWLLSISR